MVTNTDGMDMSLSTMPASSIETQSRRTVHRVVTNTDGMTMNMIQDRVVTNTVGVHRVVTNTDGMRFHAMH